MSFNSFLHSSFPSLRVLLKYISQLFHSHLNIPLLVKISAQGFQTPLPLVTTGLLNGQRISLLQSTTGILWSVLSCCQMKRLLFSHHHHHHQTLPSHMYATLKQDIVFQVRLSRKKAERNIFWRLEFLMPVSVLTGSIFYSYLG